MRQLLFFVIIFFVSASTAHTQHPFELGGEYAKLLGRGFNSGKAAIRGESFSSKNSFSIGITRQLASRKAYSVSSGYGLFIGYRHAFGNNATGSNPFAGARLLFSLENFDGKNKQHSLFITPFAEAGYHFVFSSHLFAAPALGYGYTFEFSNGFNSLDEDMGTRFIPSLSAGYRF